MNRSQWTFKSFSFEIRVFKKFSLHLEKVFRDRLKMALTLRELKGRVNHLNKCFGELKSRIFLVIAILTLFLMLKSHQNQHREMIYLRNSVAKMYTDFDAKLLTDLAALKQYLEKFAHLEFPKIELDLDEIQKASENVGSQIETLKNYDQDKTGRADLALRDSGARIAGLGPNTKPFYSCNPLWKAMGCPNKVNGPEKLIQPTMHPNECFRFKGKEATVFVKLIGKAILVSVTVEHISKKMSPTDEVTSAPRIFAVSVNIRFLSHFQAVKTTTNFLIWKRRCWGILWNPREISSL